MTEKIMDLICKIFFHTLDNKHPKTNKLGEPYNHIDFLPEGIFHTSEHQGDGIQNWVFSWIEELEKVSGLE